MFFRKTFSKKSKTPVLQLVENVRTDKGPRQRIVVSLGTQFNIPKEIRRDVAQLVAERLLGQKNLFQDDPQIMFFVDKIVKKIQLEGKWNSKREQVIRFQELKKDTAEIFIDDVDHGYGRELGPVLIGNHFWNSLSFPSILKDCGFNNRQIQSAEISILNRLIAHDSEHSILSWLKTVALEDIINLDMNLYNHRFADDRFYRISDKLLEHKNYIENSLYKSEQTLFNLDNQIFLYDLTNTYFEGVCLRNPKALYGGNQKEKRNDCPQIVVALILDCEGFIRRHHVFDGKMKDSKSLENILENIKEDFEDKHLPTIIIDRGVLSENNIKIINSYKKLKYIVACRPNEEIQFIDDFQNGEFETISGRKKKKDVEIIQKDTGEEVFLLCKSEGRKLKETAIRNKVEKKWEKELENLSIQIQKGRENHPISIERRIGRLKERYSTVAKYYIVHYTHREFSYTIKNEKKISKDLKKSLDNLKQKADKNKVSYPAIKKKLKERKEKYPKNFVNIEIHLKEPMLTWKTIDEKENKERSMDGNYLLKTNRRDLSSDEIWKTYMMLTKLENAFRDLKSHLGLRPIYHQKEDRVDGHIFISILAYHLLHSIEYTLKLQGINSRWSTIKRIVSSHKYATIQLPTTDGPVINLRKAGVPEGIHETIYKKLGVKYKNLPKRKIIA